MNSTKSNVQDKAIVLEYIMGLIHTCLLSLSKSAIPRPDFKDLMFGLIDHHIKVYGVEHEGINMISAVSLCFKRDFKSRLD